jgi:hypothetical protein
MKQNALLILAFIGLVIISGCVQYGPPEPFDPAKAECIALCKASELNLSNGPCLSDGNPSWKFSDFWVCDVAHSPREAVDDIPENQCADFREGKAHHFVEVSPQCVFIRME